MLFIDASDIPERREPPQPRAAAALAPFAGLLQGAEAQQLIELDLRSAGRSVVVGGERRPGEAQLGGDALLDDGTAVIVLRQPAGASRALRDRLTGRYLLVRGVLRDHEGLLAIEPDEVLDLRDLARAVGARR